MNNLRLLKKIENISYTARFICFTILAKICSATDLNNLCVVCDIRNGKGSVQMNNLPSACTAVVSSHNNLYILDKMAKEDRTIPLIINYNHFNYTEWGDYLEQPKAFALLMIEEKLDGIIFNNMYMTDINHPGFNIHRNERIYDFIAQLKVYIPDAVYGLAIPGHAELLPTAFDYLLLDDIVDFYVIKTINYRKCKWADTMKRTTTDGDMRKSLNAINGTISMSKILLTVQLYSEGITRYAKNGAVILTYTDMCGGKRLSVHRKYCKDSLESLWLKARLCYEYEMLGIIVQYVDYDDVHGFCRCCSNGNDYRFPGLDAIVAGSQNKETTDIFCSSFGERYHN